MIAGNARAAGFYDAVGFRCEAGSAKRFEIGGQPLTEVRYRFTPQPAINVK